MRQSAVMSTTSSRLAELRKSYERAELSEDASHADPLRQFDQWLTEAISAEIPEPNAMTVATVSGDLRPSTRVVLIKGYDERGIVWYTNYESRKGQELAGNPYAALQFHWVELERVVRIEGRVEKTSAQESDAYFATRPLDSRIGAWASPQSQVIAGPHGAGRQRREVRRAIHAEPAPPAALGRLPAGAGPLGVLAGPQEPPARPAALRAGRRRLGAGAARAVDFTVDDLAAKLRMGGLRRDGYGVRLRRIPCAGLHSRRSPPMRSFAATTVARHR